MSLRRLTLLAAGLTLAWLGVAAADSKDTLLNVSYDPTREFYVEFNKAFAKTWQAETGHILTVRQSHGGSGK